MAIDSPRGGQGQKPFPPLYWTNEAEHRRKLAEALRDIQLASQFVAVAGGLEGKPTSVQKIIVDFIPPVDIRLALNMEGSWARVDVNPTAQKVFSIQKNGSQIGTCTVSTNGSTTFSSSSVVDYTTGSSYVTVKAPAVQDATLSDFSVTLFFERLT